MSPDARRLIFTDRRASLGRSVRDFAARYWWVPVAFWLVRALYLVTTRP
jgi:hypothetical protein